MSTEKQTPTRAAVARRVDLLDHAEQLAISLRLEPNAWANSVRVVSPRDVATSLGMTRTWVYRMWPTREDFWRDLAEFECRRDDPCAAALIRVSPTLTSVGTEQPFEWLIERLDWLSDQIIPACRSHTFAAVFGYELPAEVARLVLTKRRQAIVRIEAWLGDWARAAQRRPVPGIRLADLAELVQLFIDGGRMAQLLIPWVVTERISDGDRRISPLAAAVRHLLASMTEPGAFEPATPTPAAPLPLHTWTDRQLVVLTAAADLLDTTVHDPQEPIVAYGWVTIARVARAAGVSRHTVYQYWASDDELRIDLLERMCTRFASVITAWSTDRSDAPPDAVRAVTMEEMDTYVPRSGTTRLPTLAFIPHLGHPRVAELLHGLHRLTLAESERAIAGHTGDASFTVAEVARLSFLGWYGIRRNYMLAVSAASSDADRLSALHRLASSCFRSAARVDRALVDALRATDPVSPDE